MAGSGNVGPVNPHQISGCSSPTDGIFVLLLFMFLLVKLAFDIGLSQG